MLTHEGARSALLGTDAARRPERLVGGSAMASSRTSDPFNLLTAIVEAVENPVAVIQLLHNCPDRDSAFDALQHEYGWNEHQARAVMDMQFRRVVEEDRHLIRRQLEGDD